MSDSPSSAAPGDPSPADPTLPGSGAALTPEQAAVATGIGERIAHYARGAQTIARGLAVVVVGTGIVAAVEATAAWREAPVAAAIAVILCLPAIVAPLLVSRRAKAMAAAAGQPKQVVAQARDLVSGLLGSPELQALEEMARRDRPDAHVDERSNLVSRARTFRKITKLTSAVAGQAQPDQQRHPLLVPFTPERLARTWTAISVSLWGWAIATFVLLVSFPALVISLF